MKYVKAKSEADISIRRASGAIEHLGVHGNILLTSFTSSTNRLSPSSLGSINVFTYTDKSHYLADGTFSTSGITLTRVTGSENLSSSNSGMGELEDGTLIYGSGGSATTWNLIESVGTKSAQRLYLYRTGSSGTGGSSQSFSLSSFSDSYSNGVITSSIIGPYSSSPASSSYTLRSIKVAVASNAYFWIDIPDTVINIGDQIVINSLVLRITFPNNGEPIEFLESPIDGLTGSGRFQRLQRLLNGTVSDEAVQTFNRIYLITDANKYNIGNISTSAIPVSSITSTETITATSSGITGTYLNNFRRGKSLVGSVATGGTFKQIAWGNTTDILGIIEYDTPVEIEADRNLVLNVGTSLWQDLPEAVFP